jgi:hypothetical protein
VSPRGQTKIRFDGSPSLLGSELSAPNQLTRQHTSSGLAANTLDFQRRQKYNKRLKLQYIKIFKKSTSFVHKIVKPIALFMVALLQLIFILAHPSVLFVVLLGLSLTGFFVELKEHAEQYSFFLRAKIILGIEVTYVCAQYLLNVFRIEVFDEV